jgi:hypothetical protein
MRNTQKSQIVSRNFAELVHAGFSFSVDGDTLKVTPASNLNDHYRRFISENKTGLIDWLRQSANDSHEAPDTSTLWPFGDGWTDSEIAAFTDRVLRLQGLGVDLLKAEGLAETLHKRDRDIDDRRMCAECVNLAGTRCRNQWAAELGVGGRVVDVAPIRFMLQRCGGFRGLA